MTDFTNKYCIIGAGASGITAAKNFSQRNLDFDCFEREDDVGGNWYYGKPCSSVSASTHLISSKRMTEYVDFPMPEDYPEFPSHQQACAYLRSYAQAFGLYPRITFSTAVEKVERVNKHWRVTLGDGSPPRDYGGLVIANGHHWDPSWPEIPGSFAGESLHSSQYKTPDQVRDRRVLIVGAGNSGCDIAVDAMHHAKSVHLSMRRGYYFFPKFLYGRPIDTCGEFLHRWKFPAIVRRWITRYGLRITLGPVERYGLPRPDHQPYQSHPILNSLLPYYAAHGRLQIRPDVDRLSGDRVRFVDGQEEPFDMVIYATGFRVSFPFIDKALLNDQGEGPSLGMYIFHPQYDNLFVVGLIQPDSGLWGLADYQSQVIASTLVARRLAPEKAARIAEAASRQSPPAGKWLGSQRHRYEVEHFAYRQQLQRTLRMLGSTASEKLPCSTIPAPTPVTSSNLHGI
ncbi:flavin-containing monooxygenase [Lignipirellula cremea]|uniref:Putative oxidoreductase CzcO n=1 Tax=Lignipirellula cremea TaxID=2528010 RepID=A0A518DU98_9BACT|nr:NAD(P)-binding domain-containing protein [Lignipirellula cremea]QDU95411.1 putative oxidoreductase CzcO [Lignipirellula cremea]